MAGTYVSDAEMFEAMKDIHLAESVRELLCPSGRHVETWGQLNRFMQEQQEPRTHPVSPSINRVLQEKLHECYHANEARKANMNVTGPELETTTTSSSNAMQSSSPSSSRAPQTPNNHSQGDGNRAPRNVSRGRRHRHVRRELEILPTLREENSTLTGLEPSRPQPHLGSVNASTAVPTTPRVGGDHSSLPPSHQGNMMAGNPSTQPAPGQANVPTTAPAATIEDEEDPVWSSDSDDDPMWYEESDEDSDVEDE